MRRADRLFQLVQLLAARRRSTAAVLAEKMAVSLRTVYRDVADLQSQGVPIEGEAGVGYRLRAGYVLPPLMFTREEAAALMAAVRLAQPRMDDVLGAQARQGLEKILAVLPPGPRTAADGLMLFAPARALTPEVAQALETARRALETRRCLRFEYCDAGGRASQRTVRPLACFDWGQAWTLAAWCELRQDFRAFRLDRLQTLEVLGQGFRDEPGKTLADLLRREGYQPPR